MGCFSYTCSLSGLPIACGDEVVYFALGPTKETQGIGVSHEWMPATLPLYARYNDYGSVEGWAPGAVSRAFFAGLARRAIERPVGENRVHDVAVTADMSEQEWLFALWEDRVQIKWSYFGGAENVTLAQTMVRREVWDFLVERMTPRMLKVDPHARQSGLRLSTGLTQDEVEDPELLQARFELICAHNALSWLGRPWARGSACGPQFPAWGLQRDFVRLLKDSVDRAIAKYEEESGEPYVDEP